MYLLIKPMTDVTKSLYTHNQNHHEGDSGLDLYCPDTITIYPGETTCINFQIQCEAFKSSEQSLTSGRNISYYLYPRSSIAKTPLRLANSVGIIDAGYRGNICAFVDNIKDEPYRIDYATRLFQICSPTLEPIEYSIVNALSETTRGAGGFGSTGR